MVDEEKVKKRKLRGPITHNVAMARRYIEKALELTGDQQPSSYNMVHTLLHHAYRVENSLRIEDQINNE